MKLLKELMRFIFMGIIVGTIAWLGLCLIRLIAKMFKGLK